MKLFFRNDDFGCEPERWKQLLFLAKKYQIRINAAAIPKLVKEEENFYQSEYGESNCEHTQNQWQNILEIHSHGFTHENHSKEGKKSEFPAGRSKEIVVEELFQSKKIVQDLFPKLYSPIFTPPWNRIDDSYLPLLKEAGFTAISRFGIVKKKSANLFLPEINPSIDLHTAKTEEYYSSPEEVIGILDAIAKSDATEPVGIMLHHNKMNSEQFLFLEKIFSAICERQWKTYFFSELLRDIQ